MSPRDGVGTASHLPPGSAESRGPSIPHESGLFEAGRRAHSFPDSACLCVKSMSVDCDRVGRREAEPGWYLCGGGRVHRGESEDVCVGGCECVYTLLGITSVGCKYMEGRSGILCVKS